MEKLHFYLILIVFTISCTNHPTEESKSTDDFIKTVKSYFKEVEENSSTQDMWGVKMYGPMMLVDTQTRAIYCNQSSSIASSDEEGVYKGVLPDSINIANTAFDFEGNRWTMLMLPLPKNKKDRVHLMTHELFHRIQPAIGFGNIMESNNAHLDTFAGRILLKLELEALKTAIQSDSEKQEHIENALSFRLRRYVEENYKTAENSLELNEGMAEYTALKLTPRSEEEIVTHFENKLNSFLQQDSFIRSFAYHTIPLYGYLLSQTKDDWHKSINQNTNLTNYFIQSFGIQNPSVVGLEEIDTVAYNYPEIFTQETEREELRVANIKRLQEKFSDDNILKLSFYNMNISFNPNQVSVLPEKGNVYKEVTVTDSWGILKVTDEALLSSNWSFIAVANPQKVEGTKVVGEGWELTLHEEWEVVEKSTIYELQRK